MAKRKKRKIRINKNPPKTSIKEIQDSRAGGQIAISGFTYQLLYSSYLILSESNSSMIFHLEGIEDIDRIQCQDSSSNITHIQLKHSTQKQDASFFKEILKNFLEVYLLDENRNFKLIYDFTVADGNLSKLISNNLDEKSRLYWDGIVKKIKIENPLWDWSTFSSFNEFRSKLSFEKKEENLLADEIEKKLIESYDITTDNINIFANGIKICCLNKMKQRACVTKEELNNLILSIKNDISKGVQNPAHSWITKPCFDIVDGAGTDMSYFEGKKPTPHDIASQLPIRRLGLENEITESILKNRVTVIKASSGQGKTTLALQSAYNLKSEYRVYQLLWCNNSKEFGNIVDFFNTRVKLGEKPLIIIDNLDSQLGEWNKLAQLLQEEVSYHYKLLVTTREDDWYNYGGDLSNIKTLQVVKLSLNEEEAKDIYTVLNKAKRIHSSISDWRKAWSKVEDKQLLIEYIYLLTHGEMLSEKIAHQISQISKTDTGKIKCEILRKVCLADICGIRLSASKLISGLTESSNADYGEILKSIENEFLVRIDSAEKFIEGLHPVRSQHMVDKLHEFISVNETVLQIIPISEGQHLPQLFSKLPELISNKSSLYPKIVDMLWDCSDLSCYKAALQGLFSGSVTKYFLSNRDKFDDANEHGGLFLLSTELNPLTKWNEFELSLETLDSLMKTTPDNPNLQYLCELRDSTPKIVLSDTDIYCFGSALFNKLVSETLFDTIGDIESYSYIAYWLYNIEPTFNLSTKISLETLWNNKNNHSLEILSHMMYTCFCGNKQHYMNFVDDNLARILNHIKIATKSVKLYVYSDKNEIHVEYILLTSNAGKANDESVSRLKTICMFLPIYDTYCAGSIKPKIEILSEYNIHDDSLKSMPIKNIVIMFRQDFVSLWNKTITSNYECDSIFEWLEYWISVRKSFVRLSQIISACIYKLLSGKLLPTHIITEIEILKSEINEKLTKEYKYPNEDRPFADKVIIPENFNKIKSEFFRSIRNFCNQFSGLLCRDIKNSRLTIVNLKCVISSLKNMQDFFNELSNNHGFLQRQFSVLCLMEEQCLDCLLRDCLYFNEHQPNIHFNKYAINSWYNNKYVVNPQQILSVLSSKYSAVFPEKHFYEGGLSYYPIIVDNFDFTDSDLITSFLCDCIPFTELDYDYLILIFKNNYGEIFPNGMNFSSNLLNKYKAAIEEDVVSEGNNAPIPIDVTPQILSCFENRYEFLKPANIQHEGLDLFSELLWEFSTTREVLSGEHDKEYCEQTLSNIKENILQHLKVIESKVSEIDYNELSIMCDSVLNGQRFDDESLNSFLDKLINAP